MSLFFLKINFSKEKSVIYPKISKIYLTNTVTFILFIKYAEKINVVF